MSGGAHADGSAVRSLAFHPNSLLLAVGSADGIATVYTTENPEASRWS